MTQDPSKKKKYTYPKAEKLKGKKLIDALFSEGQSITVYPLKLFYLKTDAFSGAKIKAGMAVPKKKVPLAVNRNRIKRLLREAYRLHKATFFNNTEGNFAFLILYLGQECPTYSGITAKMKSLFKKFNIQVHEKNAS